MASYTIRAASEGDSKAIIELAKLVAEERDAFLFDEHYTKEELESLWLPEPSQGAYTFLLEAEGFCGIVGVYVLHPSTHGRGSHIAHGLCMVRPEARGKGYGKALCAHSVAEATTQGYQGMRINMVVATNFAAQRVCAACGFRVLCTVPRAFKHPVRGYVDTLLMFHDLGHDQASAPVEDGGKVVVIAGTEVKLPRVELTGSLSYEVDPPLPPGLKLEAGVICGQPVEAAAEKSYSIRAIYRKDLLLRVDEREGDDVATMSINEDFATQLEAVTQIENMLPEPSKIRSHGDWMIWMVHRAWLDDPTLVDFDFTNTPMPPAHIEPRIAPKLVKAMEMNKHIENLTLYDSNLQKAQGCELAASLRKNVTVKSLNLERNWLDSNAVKELAIAIKENPESSIEHLRFSHQKSMGQTKFFGRPTEEAVGQMMQGNDSIVRLSFECDDANWRNTIDRALLRNNDSCRRRQAGPGPEDLPPAEERPLGSVRLLQPPDAAVREVVSKYGVLCEYLEHNGKMPTTVQLQHCAKNSGQPMSYTVALPMIKELRSWMVGKAVGQEVTISDVFGTAFTGTLKSWSSEHDNWAVEIIQAEDGKRCSFRSNNKDPAFSVSEEWLLWLRSEKVIGLPEIHAGA